jgi:RNA polymerase sigma factor (sigma-70 family)
MPNGHLRSVVDYLHGLVAPAEPAGVSDEQLLERFARQADEAAFGALLRQHGPLVYGVCRRILHNEHDAEDAFQATFLVLVRKVRSIVRGQSLRSWLHSVACRVALRAKTARREAIDRQNGELAGTGDPVHAAAWNEIQAVLDEEVCRLPEKYRGPVLLCYFEGMTCEEAARQLRCPLGTVATRLARARQRLQSRLMRRGLTAGSVVLLTGIGSAAVPASLADRTMQAALQITLGQSLAAAGVSERVMTLMQGALHIMALARLRWTTLYLLIALLVSGTGALAYQRLGQQSSAADQPASEDRRPPKTDRDKLQGTWLLTAWEHEGVKKTPDQGRVKIVIQGDLLAFIEDNREEAVTFTLDASKNPKAIRFFDARPDSAGKLVARGIYAVDGDELKLCYDKIKEGAVPTEFTAKKGSGFHLYIAKREDSKPRPAAKANDKLNALLKERQDTAKAEWEDRNQQFIAGQGTFSFLYDAGRRWLDSQLDMTDKQSDRVAALEAHLQRMKELEKVQQARFDAGRIATPDLAQAKYYRLEAEIMLERAKSQGK